MIGQRAREFGLDSRAPCHHGVFRWWAPVCRSGSALRLREPTKQSIEADTLSARPFCAAPIYPVVSMRADIAHAGSRKMLIGPDASEALEVAHSPDRNIPNDAPPHFIVHAEDDASPFRSRTRCCCAPR